MLQNQLEEATLPFLPLFNSKQMMHSQVEYLDFKNGKGVRYLTQYAQGPLAINNAELLGLYTKASDAYGQYLTAFAAAKTAAEKTIELRFFRAEILCFKLAQVEKAGDEYLEVGKTAPVGKYHKDALLRASWAHVRERGPSHCQVRLRRIAVLPHRREVAWIECRQVSKIRNRRVLVLLLHGEVAHVYGLVAADEVRPLGRGDPAAVVGA